MQPRTLLLCLFALSVIITGCPMSSEMPFAYQSTADKMDNSLIGTWENSQSDVEANEVVIKKGQDANTYKIEITKPGDTFEASSKIYIGWITTIGKVRYMILQVVLDSGPVHEYYLYTIESGGKKLTTHYVNYNIDDMEHILIVDQFQKHVLQSKNSEDFLEGEIVWSKK